MIQLSIVYTKNHKLLLSNTLAISTQLSSEKLLIPYPLSYHPAFLIPGVALAYYLYHLSGLQLTFGSSTLLFLLFALSTHTFLPKLTLLLLLRINLPSSL